MGQRCLRSKRLHAIQYFTDGSGSKLMERASCLESQITCLRTQCGDEHDDNAAVVSCPSRHSSIRGSSAMQPWSDTRCNIVGDLGKALPKWTRRTLMQTTMTSTSFLAMILRSTSCYSRSPRHCQRDVLLVRGGIGICGISRRNHSLHEDVLMIFTKVLLMEVYFIVVLILMTASTMWRTTSLTSLVPMMGGIKHRG